MSTDSAGIKIVQGASGTYWHLMWDDGVLLCGRRLKAEGLLEYPIMASYGPYEDDLCGCCASRGSFVDAYDLHAEQRAEQRAAELAKRVILYEFQRDEWLSEFGGVRERVKNECAAR